MQVVLCAALALTVALAWWVQRTHAGALAFKLGPPQRFVNKIATLGLRMPIGWKVRREYDEPGEAALVAEEGKPRYGRPRELVLRVHRIAGHVPLPSAEDAALTVMEGQSPARPPEKLDFLGVAGTLIEFAPTEGEGGADDAKPPALCACAVVADPRVAVSVELVGVRTFAAADVDLIQSLAKALTLVDAAHAAPLLPMDTTGVDWRASPHQSGDDRTKKEDDPRSDKPDSP
jgi:hypothetical protein